MKSFFKRRVSGWVRIAVVILSVQANAMPLVAQGSTPRVPAVGPQEPATASSTEGKLAESNDPEAREALSLLRVGLANGKAIRKGDCLIRLESSWDSVTFPEEFNPDGAVVNDESWIRFRFDYAARRFLVVKRERRERLDLDLVDPESGSQTRTSEFSRISGMCASGNGVFVFKNGSLRSLPRTESAVKADEMDRVSHLDLRMPGWEGSVFGPLSRMEESLAWLESVKFSGEISTVGNDISVRVERSWKGASSGTWRCDAVLDGESQLPRQIATFISVPGSREFARATGPTKIGWKLDPSGVWLADRIETEAELFGTEFGRTELGMKTTIAEIHWFSVNEELDETLMSEEQIRSEGDLARLVDPYGQGATSIIEKPGKRATGDDDRN